MTTDGSPWLLGAAVGLPLLMLLACALPVVRDRLTGLLWLAPLPALAAALVGEGQAPLAIGAGPTVLVLALDRTGAVLLGVAALLWLTAGLYAVAYLRDTANRGRFTVCWLMGTTGCLGVFVAADMISLYLLLALLTVGACGLVAHDETPRAQRSAAFYFALALAGESLLLYGMVLLAAGSPDGSLLIRDAAAALPGLPQRDVILMCIVAGLGLKAGLVPLHVWMPLAHAAAPVPASAVLSGAVVKAGIIGLIRFLPFEGALAGWGFGLTAAGMFTAFYGVVVGLTQAHPKAVLAYSSVSQMGLIIAVLGMGLSAGDPGAGLSAAYYATHHVLVKGALFLTVGVVAATSARHLWPVLVVATVLALSLGGLPFTGGALAKYAVKGPLGAGLVGVLANVSAAGTTLLMLHFVHRLRRGAPDTADGLAPAGRLLPWAVTAFAAVAVPWGIYLTLPADTVANPLAPAALWAAARPMLSGALVLYGLHRWARGRLPRVPEGDIAVALDAAGRAAPRLGAAAIGADALLRRWPVATLALAGLVLAFGLLLAR